MVTNELITLDQSPPPAPASAPITTPKTRAAVLALVVPPEEAARLRPREACAALGISPAFSDPQFAEILGCCPRTVFSLRKSGQLPFFTVGNRPRVRREDLAAFMARRAMPAMPVAAVQEGGRNGK